VTLDDVQVVKKALVKVSQKQVDELAERLWISFPAGYREYITKFGEGTLGGSLIRIYPPWRIEKELGDWRRRINKYWFWEKGVRVLPKERAIECVIIGDTTNGDEIVFHPSRSGKLFILPRESERVYEIRGDLLAAIEWICTSGELADPFDERNFEPFDSREEESESDETASDAEGESLDEIVELAKNWAKRHSARKQAMKDLRSHTPKGAKAKFLHESIVIDAESSLDVGYRITYHFVDQPFEVASAPSPDAGTG
jgi:hypothetical protein